MTTSKKPEDDSSFDWKSLQKPLSDGMSAGVEAGLKALSTALAEPPKPAPVPKVSSQSQLPKALSLLTGVAFALAAVLAYIGATQEPGAQPRPAVAQSVEKTCATISVVEEKHPDGTTKTTRTESQKQCPAENSSVAARAAARVGYWAFLSIL